MGDSPRDKQCLRRGSRGATNWSQDQSPRLAESWGYKLVRRGTSRAFAGGASGATSWSQDQFRLGLAESWMRWRHPLRIAQPGIEGRGVGVQDERSGQRVEQQGQVESGAFCERRRPLARFIYARYS